MSAVQYAHARRFEVRFDCQNSCLLRDEQEVYREICRPCYAYYTIQQQLRPFSMPPLYANTNKTKCSSCFIVRWQVTQQLPILVFVNLLVVAHKHNKSTKCHCPVLLLFCLLIQLIQRVDSGLLLSPSPSQRWINF